jgi:hypothetical protein
VKRVRHALAALPLALLAVALFASPAAAHGLGGVEATNYRTRIHSVSPPVEGLEIRAVDLGEKLELDNGTGEDVTVIGYRGGPRLTAAPGETVRWHDHRAHWMGTSDPPVVRGDRSTSHVVQRFDIDLRVGAGTTATVHGDVIWEPPPSGVPWLLGALALALLVTGLSRLPQWRAVLVAALGIAVVAEVVHLAGSWGATTASFASKLGSSIYAFGGIAFGLVALFLLVRRRDPYDATPAALLAGLVISLTGGLADLPSFARSHLVSTLPAAMTRTAIMLTLGLGAGVAVASALRLRRPETRRPRAPGPRRPRARAPVTS